MWPTSALPLALRMLPPVHSLRPRYSELSNPFSRYRYTASNNLPSFPNTHMTSVTMSTPRSLRKLRKWMERRRRKRRRKTPVLPLVILAAAIAVLQRMMRKKTRMTGTASDCRYSLLHCLTHSPPTHTPTPTHLTLKQRLGLSTHN